MNDAVWGELGIEPTNDERSIRRAYAVRLKRCRPEDDPDGFQRLRRAYETALSRARHASASGHAPAPSAASISLDVTPGRAASDTRNQWGSEPPRTRVRTRPASHDAEPGRPQAPPRARVRPGAAEPPSPARRAAPRPRPAPPPAAPPIAAGGADVQAIVEALLAQMKAAPERFEAFLNAHPQLFDLTLKERVGNMLLDRIAQCDELPEVALEAAFTFFAWDLLDRRQRRRAPLINATTVQRVGVLRDAARMRALLDRGRQAPSYVRRLRWLRDARSRVGILLLLAAMPKRRASLRLAMQYVVRDHGEAAVARVLGPRYAFWCRSEPGAASSLPLLIRMLRLSLTGLLLYGVIALVQSVQPGMSLAHVLVGVLGYALVATTVSAAVLTVDAARRRLLPPLHRWLQRHLTGPLLRRGRALHAWIDARPVWQPSALLLALTATTLLWPSHWAALPLVCPLLLLGLLMLREGGMLIGMLLAATSITAAFPDLAGDDLPLAAARGLAGWLWVAWISGRIHQQLCRRAAGKRHPDRSVVTFWTGLACLLLALLAHG